MFAYSPAQWYPLGPAFLTAKRTELGIGPQDIASRLRIDVGAALRFENAGRGGIQAAPPSPTHFEQLASALGMETAALLAAITPPEPDLNGLADAFERGKPDPIDLPTVFPGDDDYCADEFHPLTERR